jgi:hypothetical protein
MMIASPQSLKCHSIQMHHADIQRVHSTHAGLVFISSVSEKPLAFVKRLGGTDMVDLLTRTPMHYNTSNEKKGQLSSNCCINWLESWWCEVQEDCVYRDDEIEKNGTKKLDRRGRARRGLQQI